MTAPHDSTDDTGTFEGAAPASPDEQGVRGGPADRLDAAPGSGGVPAAGADGQTAAREELRKDLGERGGNAGTEGDTGLSQAAALGETDDPRGGSLAGG